MPSRHKAHGPQDLQHRCLRLHILHSQALGNRVHCCRVGQHMCSALLKSVPSILHSTIKTARLWEVVFTAVGWASKRAWPCRKVNKVFSIYQSKQPGSCSCVHCCCICHHMHSALLKNAQSILHLAIKTARFLVMMFTTVGWASTPGSK